MDFILSRLLGFPNVSIEKCVEESGTIILTLRFLNEEAVCPHCQKLSSELNQKRPTMIRDLSVFDKITYLYFLRRQYYCSWCKKYFIERQTWMDVGRQYTKRFEERIYERVQNTSIEQVSREEKLTTERVEGIFKKEYSQKKEEGWKGVKKIGIDEVSKRKGCREFITVIGDVEKGKLIEVINSHKQDDIIETLMEQPLKVREQIEEVSVDMWGGFPEVVRKVFPNAKIVIDRFHVMKGVNEEVDRIRKQVKMTDKESKFILLKNNKNLLEEEREKLEKILSQSKRLRKAYEYKEEFREIYEQNLSVEAAKHEIENWLTKTARIFNKVVKTIRSHLEGICNYFLSRTTNGVMEGINNRIKLIRRQAYGFVNFQNFRERLLACFSNKNNLSPT